MADQHRANGLGTALRAGRCGVLAGEAGVHIAHAQPAAIVQVNGADDVQVLHAALAPLSLDRAPEALQGVSGEGVRVMWIGPGRYLLATDSLTADALLEVIASATAQGDIDLRQVDVSDAFCVLRVRGDAALDVLAKGCPIDLETLRADACVATQMGRFDVILQHIDDRCFDLFVRRSFAHAFAGWLLYASAEYGVQVAEVDAAI